MKRKSLPTTPIRRNESVPSSPGEMDYFGHLEVFRWKLIWSLAFLLMATVICFIFIDPVIRFLKVPLSRFPVELIYFKPYEKFLTYMKVALFGGLFATIPFFLLQMGTFIYPAVERKERKAFVVLLFLMPFIFFGGLYFSYKVLTPAAFFFFNNFAPGDAVKPLWSIGEYFDLLLSLLLVCGVLFQTPFVLLFLIRAKLVKVQTLDRMRKYIVIIIAIIAGLFSPPDVVSQLLVGIPLYVLFELTVLIARFIK